MPMVHECNWLGCHKVVPSNHKFCDYHYKLHRKQWQACQDHGAKLQADKQYNHNRRDEEANAFYHSARWTRVRDFVKARDYMTSGLSGKPLNDHDYIVDHVVPRRLCSDPYNESNLWLLSRAEHNRKTKLEQQMTDDDLCCAHEAFWRKRLGYHATDD